MAGFAKDVTTPIEIPQVSVPDFSKNRSGVQDVASILNFGLNIHERGQARKAEQARVETLNEALAISKNLEGLQGQVSSIKFFQKAQEMVRNSGGSLQRQAEIGAIVASHFGQKTTAGAIASESEKFANNLEQEYKGLGEFGNTALLKVAPNSTFSELDNGTRERVIEEGIKQEATANKNANDKISALDDINEGNLNTIGSFFKADKEQFKSIANVMMSLYGKQLNLATEAGISLAAEDLLKMKESTKSVMQNMKTGLQNALSPDRLMKIPPKERTSIKSMLSDRVAFYDDQLEFLDDMEADEFKNYADTAKLLQDKDGLDLQLSVPSLMKFKKLYGSEAMSILVKETISSKPEYRKALADVTLKGFSVTGITKEDQFAIGMGIMAGIGEGRSIQDYDTEDASQTANIYWKTVDAFINSDGMIDNSSSDGITSMSIAAVNVLEFAEERGTKEDKQRALKMLNSPQFKKLYDNTPEEIQNAMGRKVIQYNRDTFADTASRVVSELNTNVSSVKYDVEAGKFVHTSTERDTPIPVGGLEIGIGFSVEGGKRAKQDTRVKELNHQLEIIKVYAKDDPFLSSLTEEEQRGFIVRSASLPSSAITGKLPEFNAQQNEASAQGVSVEALEKRTDITESTGKAADFLADIELAFNDANISDSMKQKAAGKLQDFLSGKQESEDTSDMSDEEFDEWVKLLRKQRSGK